MNTHFWNNIYIWPSGPGGCRIIALIGFFLPAHLVETILFMGKVAFCQANCGGPQNLRRRNILGSEKFSPPCLSNRNPK